MKNVVRKVTLALGISAFAATVQAIPITFSGSGTAASVAVSAQAIFDITGNVLTITLINDSAAHAGNDVPGSTLTGIFWDFATSPSLTPASATIVAGSIVNAANCSSGLCTAATTDVSGEFGYATGSFYGGTANNGIASSGYLTTGLAGDIGNFNGGAAGTNLDDPTALDGINFGIISNAAFNPNGGLSGLPLVRDRVTFVLDGVSGLSIADIAGVRFQYGTSFDETNITGECEVNCGGGGGGNVPEPATLLLFGIGLLALGITQRRYGQRR
jgi:hypothetical protein